MNNYEHVRSLVAAAIGETKGRISALRLLPKATAAGYAGSDRNFRGLVRPCREQYPRPNLVLFVLPGMGRGQGDITLIGPAGTGKSHTLIALGHAGIEAGLKVRYFTAAELVENLYRGHADNSVGRLIETVLRYDLVIVDEVGFAPFDSACSQLLFRFVAAAYERRSLAIASHWPFEEWSRFLPEHSTAVSLLDRLLHRNNIVATDGESYRMKEARTRSGGRPTKR